MKKIIFSTLFLALVAITSYAQPLYLVQGTFGDATQQANTAIITQQTSTAFYFLDGFSPYSVANLSQTIDASATGNINRTWQFGSVNYTNQTQAGFNNFIILTQNNGVAGLTAGNGNSSLLTQGGNNNVQQIYQQTSTSLAGDGGSFVITSQNATASVIDLVQVGDGVGHSASLTQGASAVGAYLQARQVGSDNSLSTNQMDGVNNSIVVSQDNPTATLDGNGLSLTQKGGDANFIGFSQWGSNNQASVSQNGNGNVIGKAGIFTNAEQLGKNNTASLNQIGDMNVINMTQNGMGNTLMATQNLNSMTIYSNQVGNSNMATISQTGF